MKLNRYFLYLVFVSFTLLSCREEIVEIPDNELTGKIYIDSQPDYAKIYLNNLFMQKLTPDSLVNLQPGSYILSVRKLGYQDTTFFVEISAGSKPYFVIALKEK